MNKKTATKIFEQVQLEVEKDIRAYSAEGSHFAKGLASEGYNGGYRDAISDVILLLWGNKPKRNHWWRGLS